MSQYKIKFAKPKPPLLISRFFEHIEPFSVVERRCIFFALITEMNLADAVLLTRKGAVGRYEGLAAKIVEKQMPHIFCRCLFWTYLEGGTAIPLLGLTTKFEKEIGVPWNTYRSRYSRLILYMPPSDFPEILSSLIPSAG